MMKFDPWFFAILFCAALIKILSSHAMSYRAAFITGLMAVFSGFVFTEPVAYYLDIENVSVKYALCGLITLTGEGFMRLLIDLSGDRDVLNEVVEKILDRVIGVRKKK